MNLAHDCLEKAATRIAQRPAVIDCETGETWTYAELDKKVNAVANALCLTSAPLGHIEVIA